MFREFCLWNFLEDTNCYNKIYAVIKLNYPLLPTLSEQWLSFEGKRKSRRMKVLTVNLYHKFRRLKTIDLSSTRLFHSRKDHWDGYARGGNQTRLGTQATPGWNLNRILDRMDELWEIPGDRVPPSLFRARSTRVALQILHSLVNDQRNFPSRWKRAPLCLKKGKGKRERIKIRSRGPYTRATSFHRVELFLSETMNRVGREWETGRIAVLESSAVIDCTDKEERLKRFPLVAKEISKRRARHRSVLLGGSRRFSMQLQTTTAAP